jgi:hypothetical protein
MAIILQNGAIQLTFPFAPPRALSLDMTHEIWDDCPPGVVSKMAQRLQHQVRVRQRVTTSAVASGLVVVALLVFAGLQAVSSSDSLQALTCAECVQLIEPYFAGTLDDTMRQSVDNHLGRCPGCRRHFEEHTHQAHEFPAAPLLALHRR